MAPASKWAAIAAVHARGDLAHAGVDVEPPGAEPLQKVPVHRRTAAGLPQPVLVHFGDDRRLRSTQKLAHALDHARQVFTDRLSAQSRQVAEGIGPHL